MAENLGEIKVEIGADKEGIEAAQKKGGKAAGDEMAKVLGGEMSRLIQSAFSSVGLGRVGALVGKQGGAAVREAVGGGGFGPGAAGAAGGTAAAATKNAGGIIARIVAAAAAHPVIAAIVVAALAVVVAFTLAVKAVKKLVGFVNSQIQRLAAVDARVAGAAALGQVARIMRDVRRAAILGPTLVRLQAQLIRIQNLIAPIVDRVLLAVAGAANLVILGLEGLAIVLNTVFRAMIFVEWVALRMAIQFVQLMKVIGPFISPLGLAVSPLLGGIEARLAEGEKILERIAQHARRAGLTDEIQAMNKIMLTDLEVLTAQAGDPFTFHELTPLGRLQRQRRLAGG